MCKGLSDARVASVSEKRLWFCSTFFVKIHKNFKVNIWWMNKCDLLKFSFVWIFHNKIVYRIYSNIFCSNKIKLCDKNKRNVKFSISEKQFSYYWIMFFIAKHISNHIIKCDQYFAFLIWIVFFSSFINIIQIIRVFNKSFRIIIFLSSLHLRIC